ncbi:MAG TPA: SDR family oxidoreductase [Chondromyces sp.]|nr:SDR family oxidoreductase [Chondromyces sp.]
MVSTDDSMVGRVCLVTGASSGIGTEIARGLARRGATVVMVARDRARGEAARDDVMRTTGNDAVELTLCDLASQRQVRELAAAMVGRYPVLHVLVHNAGLILGSRVLTEDGLETTFAVNHLAPFLLTELLREPLEAAGSARVVTVASEAHRGAEIDLDDPSAERGYSSWRAYAQSKLANILFTRELARRTQGSGIVASCLHPGVVRSGFGRQGSLLVRAWFKIVGPLLLSAEKGADTAVWLASSPEAEAAGGGYYIRRSPARPSRAARDAESARRLWGLSERLTGLSDG